MKHEINKKQDNEDSDEDISDEEVTDQYIQAHKKAKFPKIGSDQWVEKYRPKISRDICINPRKLKEVKKTISDIVDGKDNTRLLVLSGPAGSSKSTTVKVVANEIFTDTFRNNHYTNPRDQSWIEYIDSAVIGTNQSAHFEEFLQDAKVVSDSLVIIEELPNVFNPHTLEVFRRSLKEWILSENRRNFPLLVLCITEVEATNETSNSESFNINNNLTAETLLGKLILSLPDVKHLKFNPIAASFVKKTLGQIIAKESSTFSGITKAEINTFLSLLLETGDIRAIIANLQIWSSFKSRSEGKDLEFDFAREHKFNLFHAIGKIIFSSSKFRDRDPDESDYLSVQAVIDSYVNSEALILNLALMENYNIYSALEFPLKTAGAILDNLSISDVLCRIKEGPDIGIRSTRHELRKVTLTGKKLPNIKFPRHFKMVREYNKTKEEIRLYQRYIGFKNSFDNLNLLDGCLLPRIYNSRRYQNASETKSKLLYGRLGGRFKQVYADEALPIVDIYEDITESDNYMRDQFQLDVNHKLENEMSDTEESLSDPVVDSDNDSDLDLFDDSINEQLNNLIGHSEAVQKMQVHNELDDFLSDSELENLISQGKL